MDQHVLYEQANAALTSWLENPYWAAYYREAPSEICRNYIAVQFLYSDTEEDAPAREMDLLESSLTLDDWNHLLRYSSNGPERGKILRRIRELSNS